MYTFTNKLNKEEYDKFVENYSMTSIMQEYNWANIKDNWGHFHCGLYKDEKLVGVCLILIKNVFNRSSFTILGDINQNINPFYTYCSLKELKNVFDDVKYLELLKTYRSSPEIIDYSSKILKINNIHSVRKSSNINVINRVIRNDNFETLYNDVLNYKKKYTKYAIICKTSSECRTIYENIKNRIIEEIIDELKKII